MWTCLVGLLPSRLDGELPFLGNQLLLENRCERFSPELFPTFPGGLPCGASPGTDCEPQREGSVGVPVPSSRAFLASVPFSLY